MTLEIGIQLIAIAIFAIAAVLGFAAGWALCPKAEPCADDCMQRTLRNEKRKRSMRPPWQHDPECPLSGLAANLAYIEDTATMGCECRASKPTFCPSCNQVMIQPPKDEPPKPPSCVNCVRMVIDPACPDMPKCGGTLDPVTGEAGAVRCSDERIDWHAGRTRCGPTGRYFEARRAEHMGPFFMENLRAGNEALDRVAEELSGGVAPI